jgi:hypothetical protein
MDHLGRRSKCRNSWDSNSWEGTPRPAFYFMGFCGFFFFFLMVLWLERRDSNQARQVLDCLKHASRTFSLVSLEIGSNFCLEL